jgi:hypothetical protein
LVKFQKLNAVPERVADKDSLITVERVAVLNLDTYGSQALDELQKSMDQKSRMSFSSGAKFRLDPQVDLHGAGLEPGAAAFCQIGWFRHLREPEKPCVESACVVLATRRHGKLNVIDGHDRHVIVLFRPS